MSTPSDPDREKSVQAAREDCIRIRRSLGLNPDPMKPSGLHIPVLGLLASLPPAQRTLRLVPLPAPPNELPVDERSTLAVRLDELVEEFGFSAVKVQLGYIESANAEVEL